MARSALASSRYSQNPIPLACPVFSSRRMRSDTTGPTVSNTSCSWSSFAVYGILPMKIEHCVLPCSMTLGVRRVGLGGKRG